MARASSRDPSRSDASARTTSEPDDSRQEQTHRDRQREQRLLQQQKDWIAAEVTREHARLRAAEEAERARVAAEEAATAAADRAEHAVGHICRSSGDTPTSYSLKKPAPSAISPVAIAH
jgi:predicted HD phosphohydrolase